MRLLGDHKLLFGLLDGNMVKYNGDIIFQISPFQRMYAVIVYIIRLVAPCVFQSRICILVIIKGRQKRGIACIERAFFKYINHAYVINPTAGDKRVMQILLRISRLVGGGDIIHSVSEHLMIDEKIMLRRRIFFPHNQKCPLQSSHHSGDIKGFRIDRRFRGNFTDGCALAQIVEPSLRDNNIRLKIRRICQLIRNGGHI